MLSGGCGPWDRLLELMQLVWKEKGLVKDCKDAVIVPIPKKGCCDNWCGISLLYVVGKHFGCVLQLKLQEMAEDALPESQCGFRKGRGCIDMIFAA